MRLAHPGWLALLVLAGLLAVLWLVRRRWQRYPLPLPPGGSGGLAPLGAVAPGLAAALALALVGVALARPQEVLSRRLVRAQGVDMAVVLDVSGSMAALDFKPTDRLGVAKEVIREFLDRRPDDRIALVAFAGAAVTLCPLTLDHEVAKRLLDRATIGQLPDGTAIGMGLGVAVNRLRRSKARSKVVVLVTDGANNAGELDPHTAAELARNEGIVVHSVLVGKGGRVPIPVKMRDPLNGRVVTRIRRLQVETNPALLGEISRATGGRSFRARDAQALRRVFHTIDEMEKTEFTSTRLVHYRERFEPWAVGALTLLALALGVEGMLGKSPW